MYETLSVVYILRKLQLYILPSRISVYTQQLMVSDQQESKGKHTLCDWIQFVVSMPCYNFAINDACWTRQ